MLNQVDEAQSNESGQNLGGGLMQETAQTGDSSDAGRRYRYDRLALPIVLKDMRFSKSDPAPGDRVPDFDLPTLDGGRFRSADLADTGPAVLIFGSYTCPVTENGAPGLKELHKRFGDRIRFVMVAVHEAHPGKAVPQPQTFDEKVANAQLLRNVHDFEFEVAVDYIDGNLHRALSPKPNSAYLLGRDGTILYRALFANEIVGLAEALNAVTGGNELRRTQSSGKVRPLLSQMRNMAPVLDRAGGGAWRDMWRVAPPMARMAFALKTLRIRPKTIDSQKV